MISFATVHDVIFSYLVLVPLFFGITLITWVWAFKAAGPTIMGMSHCGGGR